MQYTHFSQEVAQIPLEGPNQLMMDAPILVKAKIPRQGDLLSDLVLRVSLPDIFSKAYIVENASSEYVLERSYEFAWVRQIGARLIDTVTFTIGGQKIQEFTSDWICARMLLDSDVSQYQKWRQLIADTPEYFDPANGMYADPVSGTYPNVIAWRGTTQVPVPVQNNAPSIPGRIVRVPLGLWFSDFIANSLPLVALQYHECEIQIQMRPIRDLYTVLDPNGIRLRPGVQRLPYLESDQYTGVWNPLNYGTLPDSLNNHYGSYDDSRVSMRHFLTDISGAVPSTDGWPLNATLEATYTFVRQQEQIEFATKALNYNVRQIQLFSFSGVTTRRVYRLDVHNIATRFVYFARRSDSLPSRNQYANLTNWIDPTSTKRPFVVPSTFGMIDPATGQFMRVPSVPRMVYVGTSLVPIGYSGLNIPGTQRNILRNAFITANGTPLFNSQDAAYFNEYVPFRYLKGNAVPFNDYALATQSEMWPLHVHSFALEGSNPEQPTGTLNTSRINKLEVDVDVEPIPVGARYTYDLYIYVETLNFLEIKNGLGGLKFMK